MGAFTNMLRTPRAGLIAGQGTQVPNATDPNAIPSVAASNNVAMAPDAGQTASFYRPPMTASPAAGRFSNLIAGGTPFNGAPAPVGPDPRAPVPGMGMGPGMGPGIDQRPSPWVSNMIRNTSPGMADNGPPPPMVPSGPMPGPAPASVLTPGALGIPAAPPQIAPAPVSAPGPSPFSTPSPTGGMFGGFPGQSQLAFAQQQFQNQFPGQFQPPTPQQSAWAASPMGSAAQGLGPQNATGGYGSTGPGGSNNVVAPNPYQGTPYWAQSGGGANSPGVGTPSNQGYQSAANQYAKNLGEAPRNASGNLIGTPGTSGTGGW